MKKRNLSLLALVLLIVFVLLTFLPITYYSVGCKLTDTFMGELYLVDSKSLYGFAELSNNGLFYDFLIYVCLLSAVIGIIALLLQVFNKHSKTIDALAFAPVICTVTFILYSVFFLLEDPYYFTTYGVSFRYTHEIAWGFYAELVLINAASAISVLVATGATEKKSQKRIKNISEDNVTDNLLKYKELLDEGLISQEDFDTKKKQLLDL